MTRTRSCSGPPSLALTRSTIAFAGLGLLGLLAGAAWIGSGSPDTCDDQRSQLAGSWDPQRRAEVEHALTAGSGSYGAEAAPRVLAELAVAMLSKTNSSSAQQRPAGELAGHAVELGEHN